MKRDATKSDLILTHWRESVPNDRLAHLVKDVTRAFVRSLQVRLAQNDIAFGHWTYLRILWEHDGLTQRQLSDEAGVMEPTTHSALNAMEKRGFIARRRLPGNAKNLHIFLTDAGWGLRDALVPFAQEVNALAVNALDASEVKALRDTLLKMLENLSTDPLLQSENKTEVTERKSSP
jgi:MarR family transcriptional regulator, organic hydroperoxide resistance regulator